MGSGANMKVSFQHCYLTSNHFTGPLPLYAHVGVDKVDYILFFTGDVDVTPNLNEISEYKYVSKSELQQMFEDPCMFIPSQPRSSYPSHITLQRIRSLRGSSS